MSDELAQDEEDAEDYDLEALENRTSSRMMDDDDDDDDPRRQPSWRTRLNRRGRGRLRNRRRG
jgi:hypothetical protein